MKGKLIGFGICCGVILLGFLFDLGVSKLYTIELFEVDPSPVYADGITPVNLKVRLTKGGKPVEGHDLYMMCLDGGQVNPYRVRTSGSGEAMYTYYPYKASSFHPAQDVRFNVSDESNSFIWEVNAQATFALPLVETSEAIPESTFKMSDIFGD
jgi:hypothetical protein